MEYELLLDDLLDELSTSGIDISKLKIVETEAPESLLDRLTNQCDFETIEHIFRKN